MGPGRYRAATLAGLAAVVVAVLPLVASCGGDGSSTTCSLNGCTITFRRGLDVDAEILGVEARLVRVRGDRAVLEVAGQRVTLLVDQQVEIAGLVVSLQRLTQQQAVVRITPGGGDD